MTLQQILETATSYTETSPLNRVSAEKAMRPEFVGLKMYDPPIVGVACAQDSYLLSLQSSPTAGITQPPPQFWLEGAKSVISFFFPFTQQVRESNRLAPTDRPSLEMVHTRNEGQAFIFSLCEHIKAAIEEAGHTAVIPTRDPRFWSASDVPVNGRTFTSNWSERHVAFACGVGTFSLHAGIITKVGAAGRLTSLVTALELPKAPRPYSGLHEYCSMCGVCAKNCPAKAISLEGGKKHPPCRELLKGVEAPYRDSTKYIGSCGKCQINVPCETGVPGSR